MRVSSASSPSLSVFFPVFSDEATVQLVAEKALRVAESLTDEYEVVIVDDGSPDRAGEIADKLAVDHEEIQVVHHERNLGYGAAVRTGLAACRCEWICYTDGDDEYDLYDLKKLWQLRDYYDLILTFRYVRRYSGFRIVVSQVYNRLLRRMFYTRFRDVSTGLRLVRKDIVDQLELHSDSPFIGAEIAIKTMLKGYRVGEMGIQTFPRQFGSGNSTSPQNIYRTIVDMIRCHRRVFSQEYELPLEGEHARTGTRSAANGSS
jgi:glycosyltransferase involved in cell wall biosynthesis